MSASGVLQTSWGITMTALARSEGNAGFSASYSEDLNGPRPAIFSGWTLSPDTFALVKVARYHAYSAQGRDRFYPDTVITNAEPGTSPAGHVQTIGLS